LPPEAIGPIDEQCRNGVVDIRVQDEAEGCRVARQYISFFQGALPQWQAPDQGRLRHVVPENRLRVYEVREAIDGLADEGSLPELRREFGVGIITALIRIEGKPFGLMANNPKHLGVGAYDNFFTIAWPACAPSNCARHCQVVNGRWWMRGDSPAITTYK